jgi:hypothetical protein
MASVLSSLGITAALPDPTDFLKQKEVSGQIGQARADVESTLGTVSFALDAAKTLGVPASALSNLEALQGKAKALADTTNMTPAQIEAERVKIEQELAKAQAQQEELTRAARLKKVQEVAAAIAAERKAVEGDTTLPADLAASLKALDEKAQAALKATQEAVAAKKDPAATVETGETLEGSLQGLQSQRQTIENKESSGGVRGAREALKWGAFAVMMICMFAAALLGGSVLSNAFVDESFLGIRLYYFVYGFLFFPLSLLYGAIRPPVWQATLIPWTLRVAPDATTVSERWFSYHIFSAEESQQIVGQPPATLLRADLLESGRSMLRYFSIGGLLTAALGGALYGGVLLS